MGYETNFTRKKKKPFNCEIISWRDSHKRIVIETFGGQWWQKKGTDGPVIPPAEAWRECLLSHRHCYQMWGRTQSGVWDEHRTASLVAWMVRKLPAMQETWVWSLDWEDLPEKEMATHSRILVWRLPRIEEPGGLQSMGSQRVRYDCATNIFTWTQTQYYVENR